MAYIDAFVTPVRADVTREEYRAFAERTGGVLIDNGALRLVEAWADDVPRGAHTDFFRAVEAADDEAVVVSWIEWPDRATRDAGMEAAMADPRMHPDAMPDPLPFDGKRMIFGGFEPVLEERWLDRPVGYVDAFVAPVIDAKLAAHVRMSRDMAPVFRDHGALFDIETRGDDVPTGTRTDFCRAVKAEPGETPGVSFVGWPDKETRDVAWAKMMEAPPPAEMPFDGKRIFWGGFAPVVFLERNDG